MDDTARAAAERVLDRIERDQAIHRDSVEEEIRRAYREAEGDQSLRQTTATDVVTGTLADFGRLMRRATVHTCPGCGAKEGHLHRQGCRLITPPFSPASPEPQNDSGCIFETCDHPDKPGKSISYCRVHRSFTC